MGVCCLKRSFFSFFHIFHHVGNSERLAEAMSMYLHAVYESLERDRYLNRIVALRWAKNELNSEMFLFELVSSSQRISKKILEKECKFPFMTWWLKWKNSMKHDTWQKSDVYFVLLHSFFAILHHIPRALKNLLWVLYFVFLIISKKICWVIPILSISKNEIASRLRDLPDVTRRE